VHTTRTRTRARTRAFAAVVAVGLAFSAAACGADGGDDEAATTTTAAADTPEATTAPSTADETTTTVDGEADPMADRREQLYQQYLDRGLGEEDASCMADAVVTASEAAVDGEEFDPSEPFEICGVSPESMGGEGTAEDGFRSSAIDNLVPLGYTEEQALCFADEYLERYGMDPSAASDTEAVAGIISGCGGDPALLTGG
jgi:hypothetical protein